MKSLRVYLKKTSYFEDKFVPKFNYWTLCRVFLVLQLVSVIQFIAWWNNHWMPDGETKQRYTFIRLLLRFQFEPDQCFYKHNLENPS